MVGHARRLRDLLQWRLCAADALLAGAAAWHSVVAGLLRSQALTRAALAGGVANSRQLEAAFGGLWELFKAHGSFHVMYARPVPRHRPRSSRPSRSRPCRRRSDIQYGRLRAALRWVNASQKRCLVAICLGRSKFFQRGNVLPS